MLLPSLADTSGSHKGLVVVPSPRTDRSADCAFRAGRPSRCTLPTGPHPTSAGPGRDRMHVGCMGGSPHVGSTEGKLGSHCPPPYSWPFFHVQEGMQAAIMLSWRDLEPINVTLRPSCMLHGCICIHACIHVCICMQDILSHVVHGTLKPPPSPPSPPAAPPMQQLPLKQALLHALGLENGTETVHRCVCVWERAWAAYERCGRGADQCTTGDGLRARRPPQMAAELKRGCRWGCMVGMHGGGAWTRCCMHQLDDQAWLLDTALRWMYCTVMLSLSRQLATGSAAGRTSCQRTWSLSACRATGRSATWWCPTCWTSPGPSAPTTTR